MITIDCEACPVRLIACADCCVSFLLDAEPAQGAELAEGEVAAIAVLSSAGMVPPLRAVAG